MLKEYKIKIEQILLNYAPLELEQWRLGDTSLVPERVLNWKGPWMSNGYWYGEYFVQCYLTNEGNEVITNEFDIYSKTSKYKTSNLRIEEAVGSQNYARLQIVLHIISDYGIKFEQPDLWIIKQELYFAEVKRDKDYLRDPQMIFAIVLWELLKIPFKVYKLLSCGSNYDNSPISESAVLINQPSRVSYTIDYRNCLIS